MELLLPTVAAPMHHDMANPSLGFRSVADVIPRRRTSCCSPTMSRTSTSSSWSSSPSDSMPSTASRTSVSTSGAPPPRDQGPRCCWCGRGGGTGLRPSRRSAVPHENYGRGQRGLWPSPRPAATAEQEVVRVVLCPTPLGDGLSPEGAGVGEWEQGTAEGRA
jgi:hypothetical protein